MGENILPSTPWNARHGAKTRKITICPYTVGRTISCDAATTSVSRSSCFSTRPRCCCRSAMRLSVFSTMMIAPSTIRPKSSAPRLIRFAGTPSAFIPVAAISSDSGITSVAMNAARTLPSRKNSVAITSNAPIAKFSATVVIVAFTSCERSSSTSATIPGGRLSLTSRNRSRTAVATVRLFPPASISAVPMAISRPSLLAAPARNAPPIFTTPMSLTVTGMLLRDVTTAWLISSRVRMRASACTRYASPARWM
jgi:hypothetical protein